MTTFRELQIGATFDFVGPNRYNSFSEPCMKISARKYKYPTGRPAPFDCYTSAVGSIDAEVFNVGRAYPEPPAADSK